MQSVGSCGGAMTWPHDGPACRPGEIADRAAALQDSDARWRIRFRWKAQREDSRWLTHVGADTRMATTKSVSGVATIHRAVR